MNCYVCMEKINIFNSVKGKSGRICKTCYKKLDPFVKISFSTATKDTVLKSVAVWDDCQKVAESMAKPPKKQCANCGANIGVGNRKKMGGNLYICRDCYEQCSLMIVPQLTQKTLTDIRKDMARMKEYPEFTPTHIYGKISFDDTHKLWQAKQMPVFRYEDISDFEIVEEREERTTATTTSTAKTKSGGVGRAVAGGLLFGPVGAIVGSNTGKRKTITKGTTNTSSTEYYTKLGIRIMLNTVELPSITVHFIERSVPVLGCDKIIDEINNATGFMNIILKAKETEKSVKNEATNSSNSLAEEIIKFKELLDNGLISEEEFTAKKMQILGI